jgi:hypothetical protein
MDNSKGACPNICKELGKKGIDDSKLLMIL